MTSWLRLFGTTLAFLGFAFILPATVLGQSKLYLAEYKFNDPRLYKMNLDGTGVENLSVTPATDWALHGLYIDAVGGKIYWTHGYPPGAIRRANLNGSSVETIVSGLRAPSGLDIDLSGGMAYWCDFLDNRMYRVSLDGTGLQTIVATGTQLGHPRLDVANGKIYYGDLDAHEIRRCNLDGSNNELLFSANVEQPRDIALDIAAGKLYWIDSQTTTNYVARANLDGTSFQVLHGGALSSSGLNEIEIDVAADKIYWVDDITDSEKGVWRADLDGSNAERIYASPAGWNAGALHLSGDLPTPTKTTTWGRIKSRYR